MDISLIDAVIRIAGITLLLALAALLLRDRKHHAAAIFFTPLALCLCGFLVGNSPAAASQVHGWTATIAHLLSGYAAVFLWWFCLACFDRNFRPRGPALALGFAWILIASADRGLLGAKLDQLGLSRLLLVIGLLIVAHLIWTLLRDREGDLLPNRRNARGIIALLLGGQLMLDVSIDLVFGFDWRPRSFAMAQNLIILSFTIWLGARLLDARATVLEFSAPENTPGSAPDKWVTSAGADPQLLDRIGKLIDVDRVHLDPDLRFSDFVGRTAFPERAVRHAINQALGYDHFRAFLNRHRINEACRLLAMPDRSDDKLVGVALDSGFASLASFNRAFQQHLGCTPSSYRETQLKRQETP